jgi:hypothetical protein
MMECNDGLYAHIVQSGAKASVVIQSGERETSLLGFDPSPFDRETVGRDAKVADCRQVVSRTVPAVASVSRRLLEVGRREVLEKPVIASYIVTFNLVCGRRRAPKKARWVRSL